MPFYNVSRKKHAVIHQTREGFNARASISDVFISAIEDHFYSRLDSFIHEKTGIETSVSKGALGVLQSVQTPTARFLRNTPDYLLIQTKSRAVDPVIFIEYKACVTPRYSAGDAQWYTVQVEEAAWNMYLTYAKLGMKVALCMYCPFHENPILMDFPDEKWASQGQRVKSTKTGSGTPYIMFDARKMRSMQKFMSDEFNVDEAVSIPLLKKALSVMLATGMMQTRHHENSHEKDKQTGFNWSEPFSVDQLIRKIN